MMRNQRVVKKLTFELEKSLEFAKFKNYELKYNCEIK